MNKGRVQLEPTTKAKLEDLSKGDLQELVKNKGLSDKGTKLELIERYKSVLMSQVRSAPMKSVTFDRTVKEEAPVMTVPDGPLEKYQGESIEKLKVETLRSLLKYKGFNEKGTKDILVERLKMDSNLSEKDFASMKKGPRTKPILSPIAVKTKTEKVSYTESELRKIVDKHVKMTSELYMSQTPDMKEPNVDVVFRGNVYNAILAANEHYKNENMFKHLAEYLNKSNSKYKDAELPDVITSFFLGQNGVTVELMKSDSFLVE